MKKRILFFFLVLTALFSISLLQPRSVLAANANTSVTPFPNPNYNVEKGTPSTSDAFSVAHVRNLNASGTSQGTATRLEVVVQAKSFASATNVYAIVMRKSDYDTMMPNGPGARGINDTSYCTLSSDLGAAGTTYYGIGRGVTTANSTASVVLPVVIGSADNDKILGDGGNTSSIQRIFPKATVSGSYYLDEYTLIVFAFGYTGADNSTAYYIDNFYMDSEGYVYMPSYGVRYRDNNPPGSGSVSNLPVNSAANNTATDKNTFIQRSAWNTETLGEGHPGDMTLSDTIPTRTGYKFVGWTTEARTPLAEGEAAPTDGNFYPAKGTFQEPATLNTIYDLYALWQVVPVKFSHTSTDAKKYTVSQEADAWILDWLDPLPQVGVSFSTGSIAYEQPGSTSAEPLGQKTFHVDRYEDDKTTTETYGLNIGRSGDNAHWGIATAATGPTTHSNEKIVKFVITVTDPSNNTSDTITVRFGKIKKGAQAKPDEDVNTGLEGTSQTLTGTADSSLPEAVEKALIEELQAEKDKESGGTVPPDPSQPPESGEESGIEGQTEEETDPPPSTGTVTRDDIYSGGFVDGAIIGMYSVGQPQKSDSNNTAMTDKTGTYTDYWLRLGAIYEYRPYRISDETVSYENDDAGWREVPFRKDKYKAADLATVEAAMGYKATKSAITTTTASSNASHGTVKSVSSSDIPAWNSTYGWLQWNNNIPEVHGLKVGDQYQVRFKSNDNYSSSEAVVITIGGGGGGGSSGPADPSDFVTVVCFDWDETLLGSVTVPKGADASVVQGYMTTFERSLMSTESKDFDDTKSDYFVDDAEKPLTYKRGYSFFGWLPYSSSLPTHCGRAVDGDNTLITIPDPILQDFGGLTSNITVKACYKDNSELYYPSDPGLMTYTMEVAKYSRIGTTANYIMTYRFLRQKTVKNETTGEMEIRGVPRLLEPHLRLIYNSSLINFFTLDTSDEVTFTAYPNGNGVTDTEAVMVDFYQAKVLSSAAGKSDLVIISRGSSATDQDGFRFNGTLGLVNEDLASNSTTYLTVAVLSRQVGLTGVSNNTLADVQTNLRKAWLKLNSTDGTEATLKPVAQQQGLTFDQMNYAIANEGNLPP